MRPGRQPFQPARMGGQQLLRIPQYRRQAQGATERRKVVSARPSRSDATEGGGRDAGPPGLDGGPLGRMIPKGVCVVAIENAEVRGDDLGIKLGSGECEQFRSDLSRAERSPIRAIGRQGVPDVDNSKDARGERNLCSFSGREGIRCRSSARGGNRERSSIFNSAAGRRTASHFW